MGAGEATLKYGNMLGSVEEWRVTVRTERVMVACCLRTGTMSYNWGDNAAELAGASAYVRIGDRLLDTGNASSHRLAEGGLRQIRDAFGSGIAVELEHAFDRGLTLRQQIRVYDHADYVLVRASAHCDDGVSTRRISPLSVDSAAGGRIELPQLADPKALFVPFDNDKWIRYASYPLEQASESYEVGAIFDGAGKSGLIAGSLTHDLWKTGVSVSGTTNHATAFSVYGGTTSDTTRDTLPHGAVAGSVVRSPLVFLGYFDDFTAGMEQLAQANARLTPPLKWDVGVPFGWNSWSAVGDKLDYELYTTTSDFIADRLQPHYNNEGVVYINFDSFWSNLTDEQLNQAVAHVHGRGQKAGIYWTPFTFWGGDYGRFVEGADNRYTYNDILLRDEEGNLLPELDGGLSIDPTHPGTLRRIDWQIERFIRWGFEYVKLDFMGHAAVEGVHYEPSITTGIAAYNYGMAYLSQALHPDRVGRPFFINLSIAPLFPYAHAHSRRISCDVFATIEDTAYLLNAVTYGWWINDALYRFSDPDHTVLYKSYNQDHVTEAEARSRLNASVIAGTVLMAGDDFRLEPAKERAAKLLANSEVLSIARKGRTFIPAENNVGDLASEVYFLHDRDSTDVFVAVFNLSREAGTKQVDAAACGVPDDLPYEWTDLWSGISFTALGSFEMKFDAMESTILRGRPKNRHLA